MPQTFNPPELYDPTAFGLSHATLDADSGLIFISGQVDWDQHHQVTHKDFIGQLQASLQNLKIVLNQAQAEVKDLLNLRIYVRGELEDHLADAAGILTEFLGSTRPALSGIGVHSLASKDLLVEIEAIARRKPA